MGCTVVDVFWNGVIVYMCGALAHLTKRWVEATLSKEVEVWPCLSCWTHGAKGPTMMTHVLCNRRAFTMLTWCAIGRWGQFDVRRTIVVGLQPTANAKVRRIRQLATPDIDLKPVEAAPGETREGGYT